MITTEGGKEGIMKKFLWFPTGMAFITVIQLFLFNGGTPSKKTSTKDMEKLAPV